MAKLNLGKVSSTTFTAAMQALLAEKLPIRTAFKVKTLVNTFNEELKKFSELRKAIIERHCKKQDDGTPVLDEEQNYSFEPEAVKALTSEMNELSTIELEFNAIKIDELGHISLTTQQLFDLGDVLDA